ncbi:MAG TPA: hypothetical protein VHB45_16830 [Alloacidobacterium sp.]|nr:hypothetical protein [Alloacidobacterium sp.]
MSTAGLAGGQPVSQNTPALAAQRYLLWVVCYSVKPDWQFAQRQPRHR